MKFFASALKVFRCFVRLVNPFCTKVPIYFTDFQYLTGSAGALAGAYWKVLKQMVMVDVDFGKHLLGFNSWQLFLTFCTSCFMHKVCDSDYEIVLPEKG